MLKRNLQRLFSKEEGALLLGIVIAITFLSVVGTSVLYLTSNTSYMTFFTNNQAKTYYVAESGGNFAIPKIHAAIDSNSFDNVTGLQNRTFVLENGDNFRLSFSNFSTFVLLKSTGTANPGAWFEGKRTITYSLRKSVSMSTGFDNKEDFDNRFNIQAGNARIVSTGPSGSEPTLWFKGDETLISFKRFLPDGSINPMLPDLSDHRGALRGLLSYELQLKVSVNLQGGKGDHYLLGLSFRLDTDKTDVTTDDSLYGFSFFKSDRHDDSKMQASKMRAPAWIYDLPPSFDPAIDGTPKIVLWKKVSGVYSLIDFAPADSYNVLDGYGELKPWSTLVVKVVEEMVPDGSGGTKRTNFITGYAQSAAVYPRNTISWDYSRFKPIVWTSNSQPVADGSLTSENFETRKPEEIGIHGFYDSNAGNDQFFDDFAIKMSRGGTIGGDGDIQY